MSLFMPLKQSSLFKKTRTTLIASILMLVLVSGVSILMGKVAYAAPTNSLTGADMGFTVADTVQCNWESATIIGCSGAAFGFDPVASVSGAKAHAVFKLVTKGGNGLIGKERLDDQSKDWYLHLTQSDEGVINNSASDPTGGAAVQQITSDNQSAKQIELATGGNPDTAKATDNTYDPPDGTDTKNGDFDVDKERHQYDGKSYYALCGLYVKKNQLCYNTTASAGYQSPFNRYTTPNTDDFEKAMASIRSQIYGYIDGRDDCGRDAGSLSFILCPILTTSQKAVSDLTGNGNGRGFLVELLTVSPLQGDAADNIYKVWTEFRNIALGLYILIFVAIVFGNGLGLDPYTIKRALPRLATAVLLTFASYFILQTLVDLSNLLGMAVPALIENITKLSGIRQFQLDLNFAGAALTIVIAILVALAALAALIIGIAGLIARQVIIYILILVSPLAFAAWVLPNTENLFKKWWSNLIKVLMMFPIITAILSLSLLYSKSVSSSSTLAVKMSAVLAPMFALIMIPKTFKWGGELFAAGAGFLAGRASKGVDFAKGQAKSRATDPLKTKADELKQRGLQAIGTKKNMGDDGKWDGSRRSRGFISRVPGVGGLTARKRAIKQGQREAAIKNTFKEGLKDVSDDNLIGIYGTLSDKRKQGAYGKAVSGELTKRRGEALKDYASAVRDGRDSSYEEKTVRKLSHTLASAGAIKESARTIDMSDFKDAAGNPTPSAYDRSGKKLIAEKPIQTTDQAEILMNKVRLRADKSVNGVTDENTPNRATPAAPAAPANNPTPQQQSTHGVSDPLTQPLQPLNPSAYQGPGWSAATPPPPPPVAPPMPIGPVQPGGPSSGSGGPQYYAAPTAPVTNPTPPPAAAPVITPPASAPAVPAPTTPESSTIPSTTGPTIINEGDTITNVTEAPRTTSPAPGSVGGVTSSGVKDQLEQLKSQVSNVQRLAQAERREQKADDLEAEFHQDDDNPIGPMPPSGE